MHIILTPLEASLKVQPNKNSCTGCDSLKDSPRAKGATIDRRCKRKLCSTNAATIAGRCEISTFSTFVLEQSLLVDLLLKWHLQRLDKWGWLWGTSIHFAAEHRCLVFAECFCQIQNTNSCLIQNVHSRSSTIEITHVVIASFSVTTDVHLYQILVHMV